MKKVIIPQEDVDVITIDKIGEYQAIFAKYEEKLKGCVQVNKSGYIVTSGMEVGTGCFGYHATLRELIKKGTELGYTFFVE